ncbi:translocase of chloroplast 120, chloroplastic-like [Vicia villosa]|uniref:translocase of chloroplast 120, chloroplastic-like n=1 Tax=Vicia villosa TaxID=3911 RepID=UPI00273B16F7|nr:translocase of chloroplast 120, chloroplastic-like [Vicia villosa]XP_058762763.1 translocase of chloroplast 120, chloroplastic-like [Vicia villosa]XP_058762764.1 translocase of chloroplast 120, chloroplastic-like [Vicia villosa]XP_058762765.1 translocase of chloroplast 120, chloroplastic-like [Vicia villosa]
MGKEGERVESVEGSYELKNLEGDEVFEEVIDPVKRFDDQDDVVVGGNVDVADTESALPSAFDGEELDKFQESIGVAGEGEGHLNEEEVEVIDTREVSEEDKPRQLYSSCLDGTEETVGGVSCDDSSGGKELSDLNTDGSRVFQESRDLVNGNFGLSSEKNEDEDLVNGNYGLSSEKNEDEDLEYVTPRQNGGVILEIGSTDKVDYAVDEFNTELGSDEEVINLGADAGYLKEDGLDPDLGDEKIEEQCNASGDSVNEIQDDKVERSIEMEDETIDTDVIDSDTNGQEMGISHTAEDDQSGSNSEHLETIGEAGGSSLAVDEIRDDMAGRSIEMEVETVDTDIIDRDTNGREMGIADTTEDDHAGSNSEHLETIGDTSSPAVDERNVIGTAVSSSLSENSFANEMPTVQATAVDSEEVIETEGSSPALDEKIVTETVGSSSPSENSFANEMPTVQATAAETGGSSPALDDKTVTETVGSSSSSEKSFANEMPTIQAAAADPEEGNTKVYLSKISNEENQGNYEKSFVVQEPEKIPENNAKEKQTTQITKEHELDSSSGKPVGTSTPLDHPVGLGSAAPLKPAPRVLQQPGVNNTKEKQTNQIIKNQNSEFDSSSGKSVATSTPLNRPVGLGSAAPLLKPTPRAVQQPRMNNTKEKQTNQITKEQNSELDSSSGKSVTTSTPLVRPVDLGPATPLLEPTPRVVQQPRVNNTVSNTQSQKIEDSSTVEAEEYDETREKLQMIRVKFLRLANRFGQTPHNVVVAQVLYRLGLAEQLRGRNGGRVGSFSFDRASAMAEQLESAGQEPLDFSCTIMVIGKTGVGKSSTINSIFDEVKFNTDAFRAGTKKVQDVVGTVQGIKVRVIDTPGLLPSWSDQQHNVKILHSVKHFIKKTPPDIVLYLDRLDMQSRDFSDMPLLRTITDIFGPPIWFNAIVVLTHAASAPPDGPNGTPSSYDMFVTQRSHVVQQAIRQAAGDMRLMNPVSLVENHSACRINTAGQRVLPNDQVWKPHLLLLSFASKILGEANALLKLQDNPHEKPYTARARAPPLPFLLSSLLQSRPQLKLPQEQFDDEDSLNDDLDEPSDSDDETDPDDLPPFKPLTKAQIRNLSRAQKKAYLDEVEYREKLFMKKQLKYEKMQRKMMKEMAESVKDMPSDYGENVEEESGDAASVPVPMPDMSLPASFDSDTPTHRYRYLDSSNQWLVRPVLETQGWDHDVGYEGLNVERLFVLKEKIPVSFSGQVTKDKKDVNLQMEMASSVKYGEGKATSLGFDMQTVGKDLAYTLRSETKFCNFRRNKATAGLSFTLLGDALSAGVKVEDKLIANKRFELVIAGGAMTGRDDIAYGGSLEATLRDKNYPLGRSLSTLGLSVMDWHGDLAVGCNLQSQIPIGRYSNLVARGNLNNRGTGQISIRLNSSEQLQIALIGLIPLLQKVIGYSQQLQFGQGW